jgi:ACS family glucarate transporter-like MFS transporter
LALLFRERILVVAEGPTTRLRWLLIFWLFILSAVAFLDRVNLSIAGKFIAADFHLTDIQLGYVLSAFLLGYALFQIPGGGLADRIGARRLLTVSVVWWGVFTALTALVSPHAALAVLVLVVVRFFLGVGEAVMYPASNRIVARWIPSQERGIANGWIFAGVGFGSGTTPILITYIVTHYGWRASFWISAAIGVLAGIVWFLIARDSPEQHPWVSRSELSLIAKSRGPSSVIAEPTADIGTEIVAWPTILGSSNVWLITLSYFCFGYVAWIFFGWFYTYMARVRGLNLKATAGYSTLVFLVMALASPLGGLVSDALTKHRGKRFGRASIAIISLCLASVFLILGSRADNPALASIVLAGGAGALYLSQSSFWSVTADIAAGSSGSVSAFMNMGAQVGGAVTTSLTPIIASRFGWSASFYIAALFAALGALAWLFVDPNISLANPSIKYTSSPGEPVPAVARKSE